MRTGLILAHVAVVPMVAVRSPLPMDWIQVAVLLCIEIAAFLILFFGCFIEVAVDMLRGRVADRLLSW